MLTQSEFEELIWYEMEQVSTKPAAKVRNDAVSTPYEHPSLTNRFNDFAMFYNNDFIGYLDKRDLADYVNYLKSKKIDVTLLRFYKSSSRAHSL